MNEILRVLKVEPNKKPEVVVVNNSFGALEREIGGPIDYIYIGDGDDDVTILLLATNFVDFYEHGKFSQQPNRELRDDNGHVCGIIYGTFLICDYHEDEDLPSNIFECEKLGSLTDEEVKRYYEKFKYPRESFRLIGDQVQVYEIDDALGMIFLLDEQGHRKGNQ